MEALTTDQAELAVQLYLDGYESGQVARHVGVPRDMVCKAIEDSGCEVRRPGPSPAGKARPRPKPGTFGNALRATRRLKGLTIEGLADRTSISMPVIMGWEQGRKEPTFPQLRRLAEVLGVEPMVLAGWVLRGQSRPVVTSSVQD